MFGSAGRAIYERFLNIRVWQKCAPGMGSFYRSQHELFFVFAKGAASSRNNLWTYPGAASLARTSEEGNPLAMHPTVQPLALVGHPDCQKGRSRRPARRQVGLYVDAESRGQCRSRCGTLASHDAQRPRDRRARHRTPAPSHSGRRVRCSTCQLKSTTRSQGSISGPSSNGCLPN